jgi:hypothetical protein
MKNDVNRIGKSVEHYLWKGMKPFPALKPILTRILTLRGEHVRAGFIPALTLRRQPRRG